MKAGRVWREEGEGLGVGVEREPGGVRGGDGEGGRRVGGGSFASFLWRLLRHNSSAGVCCVVLCDSFPNTHSV